ncbi:MAG TPA: hypothetical protein DDW90_08190 [Cyanobacteria bacterium UBA9971]|nr:hypothetical protein [Cyanobacteria bacterium UBA9971]HCR36142.1 hypothetical protein [Candidatus Woesebacteria bacterium]
MRTLIRLIRIDFDNLENRDCIYTKSIGTFVDENIGASASEKVGDFIKNMKPEKLYLGWDMNIYPKYKLEIEYFQ